jgi:hypothetical protein
MKRSIFMSKNNQFTDFPEIPLIPSEEEVRMTFMSEEELANMNDPAAEYQRKLNGQYAQMRLHHIQKYKQELYRELLNSGELEKHLVDTQTIVEDELEMIIEGEKQTDPEYLKAQEEGDSITMMGLLNNIQMCAEEQVFRQRIFC